MNSSGESAKRIKMPICDRTLTLEMSNDYTLPDYQPEIRRVLIVRADTLPPARYVGGAAVEFSGNVDYHVLYVGADGELYSMPLNAQYSLSAPISADLDFDFGEGVTAFADVELENITTRLTAPRKITVKSKLTADVKAYATMEIEEAISGEHDPMCIERQIEECTACDFLYTTSDVSEVSAEIIPENADCRVISASGDVFITEVRPEADITNIRGEVLLNVLTASGDESGNVSLITRKIPFNTNVDTEGNTADAKCTTKGYVCDISVSVEEDRIICDLKLLFEILAQKDTPFSYTRDIYSTESYSNTTYRDHKIPASGYCICGNFSMNDRMTKENIGFPENAEIVDTYGVATAQSIESQNGKNILIGQVKYTVLVYNNGEFSTLETILPLRYEFDNDNVISTTQKATVSVISCRARQDSESVSIDSEMAVSAWGASEIEIDAVSEVSFGEKLEKNKRDIIIYYLTPEDTTWSVAKKYHIPFNELKAKEATQSSEYVII